MWCSAIGTVSVQASRSFVWACVVGVTQGLDLSHSGTGPAEPDSQNCGTRPAHPDQPKSFDFIGNDLNVDPRKYFLPLRILFDSERYESCCLRIFTSKETCFHGSMVRASFPAQARVKFRIWIQSCLRHIDAIRFTLSGPENHVFLGSREILSVLFCSPVPRILSLSTRESENDSRVEKVNKKLFLQFFVK